MKTISRPAGWHCPPCVPHKDEGPRPLSPLEAARNEWLRAGLLFDQAVGAEMVDRAIRAIRAAEKRYMRLLLRSDQSDPRDTDHRRRNHRVLPFLPYPPVE